MMTLPVPVLLCDRFLSRARGLLGREHLLEQSALLLTPCRAVHTFGIAKAIDLAFLDGEGRVLEIVPHLNPRRWWRSRDRRTLACLETGASQLERWGLKVGVRLAVPFQRSTS